MSGKPYLEIAQKNGISLTKMALAFINQQPFVTSNIIGATNLSQLSENIKSIDLILDEEIISEIEKIYSVNVTGISTMVYAGKVKSRSTKRGQFTGKRTAFKKAIVTLKEDQKIDFFQNV